MHTIFSSCMIGYVGLNEDSRLGKGAVKEKFCGTLRPPSLSSEGPRLVLTLDTHGAVRGGRFMAKYKFLTGQSVADYNFTFVYTNPFIKTFFLEILLNVTLFFFKEGRKCFI